MGVTGLSDTGIGVLAQADSGIALQAVAHRGVGAIVSSNTASGPAGTPAPAVFGTTTASSRAAGIYGKAGSSLQSLPDLAGVIGESSSAPGLVGLSSTSSGVAAKNSSLVAATMAATNTSSGDAVFGYSASGVGVHAKNGNPNVSALLVEGATFLVSAPNQDPLTNSTGAYLSRGGVWTDASDRAAKDNFAPVDAPEVLTRVARLPIHTWNYKTETPAVRHVGPVAQEFHAAFGVGADDKHIAALDANGVALAAIQGLNQKVEQAVAGWRAEHAALKRELSELKSLVNSLSRKLNGGGQ
jgi:hypothetical protein